jgi:hypothetical protein
MAVEPFIAPFVMLYPVGRTPWPLSTDRTTQTEQTRTQTSMRRVGFEPETRVTELQ